MTDPDSPSRAEPPADIPGGDAAVAPSKTRGKGGRGALTALALLAVAGVGGALIVQGAGGAGFIGNMLKDSGDSLLGDRPPAALAAAPSPADSDMGDDQTTRGETTVFAPIASDNVRDLAAENARLMSDLAELRAAIADMDVQLQAALAAVDGAAQVGGGDAALAQRVAALEQRTSGAPQDEERLARIEARLVELAELDDAADQATMRRDLGALQARVETLAQEAERNPAEAAWRFAALRDAAAGGAPFESARLALARLLPNDPDLDAMQDAARSGVPTIDELRRAFPAAEIRMAQDSAPDTAQSDNFGWLRGLVSVQRADNASDAVAADAVTLAQDALAQGDLTAAIDAVQSLDGGAAQAASYWLGRAQARQRLNERIEAVQRSLMREATR